MNQQLKALLEEEKEVGTRLRKIKDAIKAVTGLPDGWHITTGDGMAGGVNIVNYDYDDGGGECLISVSSGSQYGDVFYIKQDCTSTQWIDPHAVEAAIKMWRAEKDARQ